MAIRFPDDTSLVSASDADNYDALVANKDNKELGRLPMSFVAKKSEISHVDITSLIPLPVNTYYTLTTAIAAVPTDTRKAGLVITFRENATVWRTYQYQVANVTDASWLVASNWKKQPDSTDVAAYLFNVNVANANASGFYTLTTAIAAVPTDTRKAGLVITFRENATVWRTYQYQVANVTDASWLVASNWKNTGSGGSDSRDFYNASLKKLGYYNIGGSFNAASTSNKTTDIIFCEGFQKVEFNGGNPNASNMAIATFWDKNMSIVKEYTFDQSYTDITVLPEDAPNATYFQVSSRDNHSGFYARLFVAMDIVLTKLTKLTDSSKTSLDGANVLWLGTSIPAGSSAILPAENVMNKYPQLIAKSLGFNVYNEAIPASCVKRGRFSEKTETDPFGMTGMLWERLSIALSWTTTEMQNLFDNWTTWQPLIRNAPETLTQAIIDKSLNACHDRIFAKYWGPDATLPAPKIVVLDHLRNDFIPEPYNYGGEDVNIIPTDPYDRTTGIGALNYIVKTILGLDNKLKILVIGHYDSHESSLLIGAQETFANYWRFPFLKNWEKTGFTLNTIRTDGYWSGETSQKTWIPSGNPEGFKDLAMINIHLPDGVHPGNDASGDANRYLSNLIGGFLKENFI